MHPRIDELIAHLHSSRAQLRAAVDAVPPSRRRERPGPDRWSVAEVLEHLGLVEQRVADALGARLAAAKAGGLASETETSSVLASFDVARILDRSRRFMTGEGSKPKAGLDVAAAWEALERSRDALIEVATAGDGLALGEVSSPHPVLGLLTMYEWLAFLGSHDARHAAQISEIGAHLSARRD
jgi:hypothetical protein